MVEGRKTSGLFGGALALGVSTPAGGLLARGQVEVQQQPQRFAGGLQIGDHLSDVDGKNLRNRLELHDQLAGDQQVQLGLAYGTRTVADRDRYLPREGDPPVGQLQAESLLVDGLEETRPQGAMHLDRSPNGLAGQGVQFRVWFRADAHPKSSSKADDGFVRIRSVPTLRRPGQPRLPHPRSSLLSDPRPWSGLSARARGRPQTWGTKIMSARGPVPTIRTR